ncbi:UV radiation resistance-associated protein [Xylaria bambusicola]|uniref:UV radiation resistance-associated protein n=1 Tax=Xylaria bambusicola TaxID=326684 RepID=UPI0020075349|nr:UV radiation resistance-associated protein [Xylaria bambusicola]KAI0509141.1 UV radiation resistance-associated protein [Xylaria bambusicola]
MLPQNRRLRHLQGIYIRNLSFTKPHGRASDDLDADLHSTKPQDPQRQLQLQLQHARSSESLRPRAGARRRSTAIANATPVTRHKHLEYKVESRAADVFFSLHCDGEDDPVYISEVGLRSMNFNFRFFDLSGADPRITRSSELKIRVWAKRRESWGLLLSQDIDLRSLHYVGSLRNHHFPPNCIIFHLQDGMYSLDLASKRPEPKQTPPLPTSSYNVLMKLSNLNNSIEDALATRKALTAQINSLLEKIPEDTVPQAQESARVSASYLAAQKRAVRSAQTRRDDLETSIQARRDAMKEGQSAQARASDHVEHAQSKLPASQELISATRESIHGQRRRICEDLAHIFPITPVPSGAPLSFSICGIPLPNSDYDPTSSSSTEDTLSAALGNVAQLTHALQFYLSVPLPYPVTAFGSRSSIRDDISLLPEAQRVFPLFLRGGATAQYRFDYGWFLLNKDIEALCVSAGLKIVDIRHTLPNLKYLLYVCSAGSEEVPERKRGGIRGLWAGRMRGRLGVGSSLASTDDGASSTAGSRRGSMDSEILSGKQRETLSRALGRENGHGSGDHSRQSSVGAAGRQQQQHSPVRLPFDEGAAKLTLRTKGLRENVGAHA